MTEWLADDVAVVTGGASGNGRAICTTLAEYGADVVVADIRRSPGRAASRRTSSSSPSTANAASSSSATSRTWTSSRPRSTRQRLGGVSILVNNAGITEDTDFLDETEADFDRIMDINVKGPFFASQLAAERMIDADRGGAS